MTHGSVDESTKAMKAPTSTCRDVLDLIGCTAGIYVCYLGYGILQEKLYKTEYGVGPEKDQFTFSWFLVCFQCIVNAMLAQILLWWSQPPPDKTPKLLYFQIGFSFVGAMYASNAALAYVSYPTQALAKSCKMIPVMLARIVTVGKVYSAREYMTVIIITAGIAVFMLMKPSSKKADKETSPMGLFLLAASLVLDGYTGPTQENIISKYNPTTQQLMLWLNLAAIAMVSVVLGVTGEIFTSVAFVQMHPAVLTDVVLFSLLSALGQNFILLTLFRFDSLVLTTVTTTRKFFTILASVVWFGHGLHWGQWSGIALVFAGLAADSEYKYSQKKVKNKESKKQDSKATS